MSLLLEIFYDGIARLVNGLTCDDILLTCDTEFESNHGRGQLAIDNQILSDERCIDSAWIELG